MQRLPGLPEYGLQAPPSSGFGNGPAAPAWDAGGLIGLADTTGSAGTLGGSVSTLTDSGGVSGSNADGFQDLAAAWGLGVAPADPATAAFDSLELNLDDLRAFDVDLAGQHSGASGAAPASAGTGTTTTTGGPDSSSDAANAAAEVEDRKERQRAQNRAKQARFRQRQKERREEMEEKLEAAEADLERERQLNNSIRQTGAALEAMKLSKDSVVAVLQAAGSSGPEAGKRAALPAPGATSPDLKCTLAVCNTGVSVSTPNAELICHLPFEARAKMCCAIFCATESAQKTLVQRGGSNLDGFALDKDTRVSISEHLVTEHPQMLEAVLSMSEADVFEDWAEFGEFAAEVVAAVDSGAMTADEAENRLQPAVMYQCILHTLLMKHRPEYEQRLLAYTTHPGETEEQATSRWRQVAEGMNVSVEQCRKTLPHFHAYCDRMRELGDNAASALATLQQLQQSVTKQLSMLGDASLSSMVGQYIELAEAMGALTAQPTAALLILEDFFSNAGAAVTLLQKARMTAACRPLHPDVPAIVQEGLIFHGLLPPEARTVVTAPLSSGRAGPSG
ncbi:hypothetical protein ABPG77_002325 [Micractinium sp. CCAP 211/92]